ncbi:MAG: hypothetical protein HKP61_17400 [Dactylosporangium sp.]|nr:phosphoribosyltransferase family protein [Dactylosporangium sp.]NNJ62683.1 hypothetical protein [Dactylosporangium sp.]
MNADRCWAGTWVTDRLGVRVAGAPPRGDRAFTDRAFTDRAFTDLAGLAVRRNPRRAHLVVSTVLGKHIPVHPATAVAAGHELGTRTAASVASSPAAATPPAVVLGCAETATALGHLVADCLPEATYLHSTRRRPPGHRPLGSFDEQHSHARRHLLLPADPSLLATTAPVVIVDDELTTGRTITATIHEAQRIQPRDHYVIATLLDLRTAADRAALAATARSLGARIEVVALVTGELTVPDDVLDRGLRLVDALDTTDPVPLAHPTTVRRLDPPWPSTLPQGGQHGFAPGHRARFAAAIDAVATVVADGLPADGPLLVLGTEELMYAPMRLAERLAAARPGAVRFSSTTRSPVLPVGEAGYAVRTRLSFASHDTLTVEDEARRFAYNVAPGRLHERYEHVVVVVDAAADSPALWAGDGLVEGLRRVCGGVSVVVLPAGGPAPGRTLDGGPG